MRQATKECRSPWAALGVARGAELKDVKRRYKALAAKWHPDKHGGDADAAERFKEFHVAYGEVLADISMGEGAASSSGSGTKDDAAAGLRKAEESWRAVGVEPDDARKIGDALIWFSVVGLGLFVLFVWYLVNFGSVEDFLEGLFRYGGAPRASDQELAAEIAEAMKAPGVFTISDDGSLMPASTYEL